MRETGVRPPRAIHMLLWVTHEDFHWVHPMTIHWSRTPWKCDTFGQQHSWSANPSFKLLIAYQDSRPWPLRSVAIEGNVPCAMDPHAELSADAHIRLLQHITLHPQHFESKSEYQLQLKERNGLVFFTHSWGSKAIWELQCIWTINTDQMCVEACFFMTLSHWEATADLHRGREDDTCKPQQKCVVFK